MVHECAALGARLMNLSPEQTRQAIGIAEYNAPRSQIMRVERVLGE